MNFHNSILKEIANNKDLFMELFEFCKQSLKLDEMPKILFENDEENAANPLGKTAYYDPDSKEITIFVTNRHIKDIMRSICHELIHHSQNCCGKLELLSDQSDFSFSNVYELEKEAYEQGNLMFRKFEEQKKNDNPTKEKN